MFSGGALQGIPAPAVVYSAAQHEQQCHPRARASKPADCCNGPFWLLGLLHRVLEQKDFLHSAVKIAAAYSVAHLHLLCMKPVAGVCLCKEINGLKYMRPKLRGKETGEVMCSPDQNPKAPGQYCWKAFGCSRLPLWTISAGVSQV